MHIIIGLILAFVLLAIFRNRKTRICRWRRNRSGDNHAGVMFKCMMCGAEIRVPRETPPNFCMKAKQSNKKRGHPKGDRAGRITQVIRNTLDCAFNHHLFDFGNRLGGVQTLGAGFGTVHDCVTAIQFKRIF